MATHEFNVTVSRPVVAGRSVASGSQRDRMRFIVEGEGDSVKEARDDARAKVKERYPQRPGQRIVLTLR